MKRFLYVCGLLGLATLVGIWRMGTPVDEAVCSAESTTSGPLGTVISQYADATGGADWRDNGSPFTVLELPAAHALAREPRQHYCEALSLLQNPQRTPTEKVHTVMVMLSLPIDYYLGFMDRSHELYQRGLIDASVLGFVMTPRGTALNYWWLPQWRSRYQRDAPGLYSQAQIEDVLSGAHWFDYPGRGF